MEETQEILQLLRENNEMLKEIVAILWKTQDPDYIMQENTTDFYYEHRGKSHCR